jgi:hypothetical protein
MFASFHLPYVDRGQGPTIYHGIMLKQLAMLGTQQLALIADEPYFSLPAPWGQEVSLGDFRVRLPSRDRFDGMTRFAIPQEVFASLNQRCRSHLDALRILLNEDYPPLRGALVEILETLTQREKIEAILTWCNVPSLNEAAARFNLPVIHNELGPLRPPLYQNTVYFDFRGVNGETSTATEMPRFCQEARQWRDFEPLTLPQIRELLSVSPHVATESNEPPEFNAGVALQVEYDSNLLVFARGMTNFEAIYVAQKGLRPSQVLIRHHPSGQALYSSALGVVDDSADSVIFLRRCETVFTINSSVAFECLLQDKPVRILGDSPATTLSAERLADLSQSDRLLSLNYLFLCYLVPARFLFDVEYYHWRLARPSLQEIYRRHLEAYRQHKNLHRDVTPDRSRLHPEPLTPRSHKVQWGGARLCQELEQARAELSLRTAELDESRQALRDRTAELDRDRQTLRERTAELHQDRQALRERTEELDGERQTLSKRTEELDGERQALRERGMELEQARQEAARQAQVAWLLQQRLQQTIAQLGELKTTREPMPAKAKW